jgi:IclR family acetate operon transcriptional repressor
MPPGPARSEDVAKKTGTQAIERAISILRLFADGDGTRSLTEVSRAAGLNPATTHRILASLVRERLLANDPSSERYEIGPDSLFLFAAAARRYGIAAARTELETLTRAVQETAAIGVLDGTDTIVVLQVESDLPLRFSRKVGTRVPSHVSAMGKAILAHAPDVATRVEALGDLHRFTDHTVTDRPLLLAELAETRERGWAVNDHERWDGVRALAVPIVSGTQPVTASLGVQGPAERMPDSRRDEIIAALRVSAHRLSLHLPVTTL